MTAVQAREAEKGHFLYAHELNCSSFPTLSQNIRIPKYFLNNIYDMRPEPGLTAEEWMKTTHFPAIFFGSEGSSSPLHSDCASSVICLVLLFGPS
jgi:hypothetical protein